jgi:ABC-type Fe3+ transport system permease subunit
VSRSAANWLVQLPLGAALLFVALFVLLPLGEMLVATVQGPDGLTLAAWAALAGDENLWTQLGASLRLGIAATVISLLLGGGHAWLTVRTDLPLGGLLGPLGIAPLVVPPIFVAMGFADLGLAAGFWPCALLLGICHAPFVAVLTARGLRAADGRAYEAAWLPRGRGRAELQLLRTIAPELLAGCILAFLFTLADHGVPEFLTVKGKTWHTYAEGVFSRWTRRAVGTSFVDLQSPIVAALPFVAGLGGMLWLALRLRAHAPDRGAATPLPRRALGRLRWPALGVPLLYLTAGVAVPVLVMARWALGSAQRNEPMSLDYARRSFQKAMDQGLPDLLHSTWLALAVACVTVLLALPLARAAARRWSWLDLVSALPAALPAILLGIALVDSYHDSTVMRAFGGDFYSGWGFAVTGYTARLLPFAALPLAALVRRQSLAAEEAGRFVPRSAFARSLYLHLPPLLPGAFSAWVLVFVLALRELDLAVVLPAANATAVRRLANAVHFQHEDWSGVIGLLLLGIAVLVPLLPSLLAGRRLSSLS